MDQPRKKEIRFIPYVCGAGASVPGSERGPVDLKVMGLEKALSVKIPVRWQDDPLTIYDQQKDFYVDLPPLGSTARRKIVLDNCRAVADSVERAVNDGAFPVTLGGDHSMAAGTIAGFARAKQAHGRIGVIWIDAHPDINTPETTPSMAYHGMPMAALLGLGDHEFSSIGGVEPVLRPEHIVFLGLRSIDPPEEARIRQLGIKTFIMKDIPEGEGQFAVVLWRAMEALRQQVDYLVLSIDLDAFDPSYAPSVGSPVGDGFNRQEVIDALRNLAKTRAPDMVEIVEYNPSLGGGEVTYDLLREILDAILND